MLGIILGHGAHAFGAYNAIFLGLVALGVGYWVCVHAGQGGACPKWGKFLGGLITVVALFGLVCASYHVVRHSCCGKKGGSSKSCPYHQDGDKSAPDASE